MFYCPPPRPCLGGGKGVRGRGGWPEVGFGDLIYVFSVTQLSHYLLHNLTWAGLLKETILWFAVWMLWQHTIWVTNRFNSDTRPIRILLFIAYYCCGCFSFTAFLALSHFFIDNEYPGDIRFYICDCV